MDLNEIVYYFLGFFSFMFYHILKFVFYVTKVAVYDAYWVFKNGILKEGKGRWNWLWIIPWAFFYFWKETAFDELRGYHRVL